MNIVPGVRVKRCSVVIVLRVVVLVVGPRVGPPLTLFRCRSQFMPLRNNLPCPPRASTPSLPPSLDYNRARLPLLSVARHGGDDTGSSAKSFYKDYVDATFHFFPFAPKLKEEGSTLLSFEQF